MAKKKATKKASSKKVSTKEMATLEDAPLVETSLSSHSLAALTDLDSAALDGVALDVLDEHELFKNDIIVPKIWLIQAMSELRKDGKAREGDYTNSRSEEILLGTDSEDYLPIIVMKTFKRWQTFEIIGDKKEFVKSELMTLDNAKYQYEFTEDGKDFKRRQVISAYVLLGQDAQKGIVKPYVIDFAATSKGAGRDLVSDIKVLNTPKKDARTGKILRQGYPSWVAWFKLSKYEDRIGKDDFYVKSIKFGGVLPADMFGMLRDAYDEITSLIDSDAIEIDDRDLNDSDAAPTTNTKADVTADAGNASAKL